MSGRATSSTAAASSRDVMPSSLAATCFGAASVFSSRSAFLSGEALQAASGRSAAAQSSEANFIGNPYR